MLLDNLDIKKMEDEEIEQKAQAKRLGNGRIERPPMDDKNKRCDVKSPFVSDDLWFLPEEEEVDSTALAAANAERREIEEAAAKVKRVLKKAKLEAKMMKTSTPVGKRTRAKSGHTTGRAQDSSMDKVPEESQEMDYSDDDDAVLSTSYLKEVNRKDNDRKRKQHERDIRVVEALQAAEGIDVSEEVASHSSQKVIVQVVAFDEKKRLFVLHRSDTFRKIINWFALEGKRKPHWIQLVDSAGMSIDQYMDLEDFDDKSVLRVVYTSSAVDGTTPGSGAAAAVDTDEDWVAITVRTKDGKTVTASITRFDKDGNRNTFAKLFAHAANFFGCTESNLILQFEGDTVTQLQTPMDIDVEDDENEITFDAIIRS